MSHHRAKSALGYLAHDMGWRSESPSSVSSADDYAPSPSRHRNHGHHAEHLTHEGLESPLQTRSPSSIHADMTSRSWLKLNGLKKNNLTLQQILEGRRLGDGERPHSPAGDGFVASYQLADGTTREVYLLNADLEKLEKKLLSLIRACQRRIEWLGKASRRVFGTLVEDGVTIVVDFSDGMAQSVHEVKQALRFLISEQVRMRRRFNIIAYATEAEAWEETQVDVTEESLDSAWTWLQEMQAGGQANLYDAVKLALEDQSTDAVYVVSSGRTNTDAKRLVRLATDLNSIRGRPVNTVAYNVESDEGVQVLKTLAVETGGRFHMFVAGSRGSDPSFESDDIFILDRETERAREVLARLLGLQAESSVASHHGHGLHGIESPPPHARPLTASRSRTGVRSPLSHSVSMSVRHSGSARRHPHVHEPRRPTSAASARHLPSLEHSLRPKSPSRAPSSLARSHSSLGHHRAHSPSATAGSHHHDHAASAASVHHSASASSMHHESTVDLRKKDDALLDGRRWVLKHGVGTKSIAAMEELLASGMRADVASPLLDRHEQNLRDIVASCKARTKWLRQSSRELFGNVLERRAVFAIDTSSSMKPRMEFVRDRIRSLLNEQIKGMDSFNIIRFDTTVDAWAHRISPVTERNLDDAWEWVRRLEAKGTTNVEAALKIALSDADADAIYLVTDGVSDRSIIEVLETVRAINTRSIPIHAITFGPADASQATREQTVGEEFALRLAAQTAGRYLSVRWDGKRWRGVGDDLRIVKAETARAAALIQRIRAFRGDPEERGRSRSPVRTLNASTHGHSSSRAASAERSRSHSHGRTRASSPKHGHDHVDASISGTRMSLLEHHRRGRVRPFEEPVTSRQWLAEYGLEHRRLVARREDLHGERLRDYVSRLETALAMYRRRHEWLCSGSRRVFGSVVGDNVVFLVGTSRTLAGEAAFVKDEVCRLLQEQLDPAHRFTVVAFDAKIRTFRDALSDATSDNVLGACEWVQKLGTGDGADTIGALRTAFSIKDTDAIYLITDRVPDHNVRLILDEAAELNARVSIPIHTVSFNCVDVEANDFLAQLAEESGGRYHYYIRTGLDAEYEGEDVRLMRLEIERAETLLDIARSWELYLPGDERRRELMRTAQAVSLQRPSSAPPTRHRVFGPDIAIASGRSILRSGLVRSATPSPPRRVREFDAYVTQDELVDIRTHRRRRHSPGLYSDVHIGQRVIVRRDSDGFFVDGSIKVIAEDGKCLVISDTGSSWWVERDNLLTREENSRTIVAIGCRVLARSVVEKGSYIPAIVEGGRGDLWDVLFYNNVQATVDSADVFWLSIDQYDRVCLYIRERVAAEINKLRREMDHLDDDYVETIQSARYASAVHGRSLSRSRSPTLTRSRSRSRSKSPTLSRSHAVSHSATHVPHYEGYRTSSSITSTSRGPSPSRTRGRSPSRLAESTTKRPPLPTRTDDVGNSTADKKELQNDVRQLERLRWLQERARIDEKKSKTKEVEEEKKKLQEERHRWWLERSKVIDRQRAEKTKKKAEEERHKREEDLRKMKEEALRIEAAARLKLWKSQVAGRVAVEKSHGDSKAKAEEIARYKEIERRLKDIDLERKGQKEREMKDSWKREVKEKRDLEALRLQEDLDKKLRLVEERRRSKEHERRLSVEDLRHSQERRWMTDDVKRKDIEMQQRIERERLAEESRAKQRDEERRKREQERLQKAEEDRIAKKHGADMVIYHKKLAEAHRRQEDVQIRLLQEARMKADELRHKNEDARRKTEVAEQARSHGLAEELTMLRREEIWRRKELEYKQRFDVQRRSLDAKKEKVDFDLTNMRTRIEQR